MLLKLLDGPSDLDHGLVELRLAIENLLDDRLSSLFEVILPLIHPPFSNHSNEKKLTEKVEIGKDVKFSVFSHPVGK